MKKSVVSVLLFILICGGVLAQSQNPVTWDVALLKRIGSEGQSFSPESSINLKSGDEYCIYIKSDSPGYCYVIQQDANDTSSIIFRAFWSRSGPFTIGEPELILENGYNYFAVPEGRGLISYDVVVSYNQIPNLESLWNNGAGRNLPRPQQTALKEEVMKIRDSLSTFARQSGEPTDMAGGARTGVVPLKAYQYKGQNIYVETIAIRY